jgi:competence ComEA-like helix-hairpin-helix protein
VVTSLLFSAKDSITAGLQSNTPEARYPARQRNWHSSDQSVTSGQQAKHDGKRISRPSTIRCSPFDPNTVQADELYAMGVPSFVSRNLLAYREAGGAYRKPGDLLKIYGIDSSLYQSLAPCITITDRPDATTTLTLDINAAGETEWKLLPGIGDVLARRIVKYREALGGFHSATQVADTYGLPAETFTSILPYLISSPVSRKIGINTATAGELQKHPYISRRQATAIVSYREHHGAFSGIEELFSLYVLDSAWLHTMEPYLGFERPDTSEAKAVQ